MKLFLLCQQVHLIAGTAFRVFCEELGRCRAIHQLRTILQRGNPLEQRD